MINYDLPIHPLAKLFPEIPAEEFKKLKADIEAHGLIEPIMLSADGQTVLDGRHRLRACKELGLLTGASSPTLFTRFIPDSFPGMTEADFIWSANALRRHLTDDQRAAIAYKWVDAVREAAKENQKRKSVLADSPKQKSEPIHTRKEIAKRGRVSEHRARQIETVAKNKPELLPKVESGAMKLKDAVAQTPQDPAPKHLSQKAKWVNVISPAKEMTRMLGHTSPTVLRLEDFPETVPPGAKSAALLGVWVKEEDFAFKPIMEALEDLGSLKDWSQKFLMPDKLSKGFNWKEEASFKKYASFQDFYKRELEETWGTWDNLQATYRQVAIGAISEVPFHEEGALTQFEHRIRTAVTELWPKNYDLTPLIRALRRHADHLEAVQKDFSVRN